ncbi:MAG: acyl carrier protein [Thermoleophilaceae bacterium]
MPATVTRENVQETIVEAVAKLGPDPSEITPDATFESLEIDSLDLVEIAQVVEDEYGVELKSEDASRLQTVRDAVELVVERAS